jgi:chemotaxis protein CheD
MQENLNINDIETINSKNIVYVPIGGMDFNYSPKVLKTIVGSCVAIALYAKSDKFGALAHIMLSKSTKHKSNNYKYADFAINNMVQLFYSKNYKSKDIVAKLVGGAKIYFSSQDSIIPDIGKENVLTCRKLLIEKNITIIAEDVLGVFGRTVLFNLQDGSIIVRSFDGNTLKL